MPVNTANFKIINEENIAIYEKAFETLGGKNIRHYGHASEGRVDGIALSASSYITVKEKIDAYQKLQKKDDKTFIGTHLR